MTDPIYNETDPDFPLDSRTLIDLLDRGYPPACIQRGQSEIDAHRYAAVREFIDELIALRDEADEATRDTHADRP